MKNRVILGSLIFFFLSFFLVNSLVAAPGNRFVRKFAFKDKRSIRVYFAGPVDPAWTKDLNNFSLYEKPDPDILIKIDSIKLSKDRKAIDIHVSEELNILQPHILTIKNIIAEGKNRGTAVLTIRQSKLFILFSILIGALLIKNFVFSKYLGLCIFFGTSQRKETAIGMGISFTIVMILSVIMSWLLYNFVLKPYHLDFLQIIVFIGIVSMFTQMVDTILRKVNPYLFKKLGVYLVLIVTNCVILAVPLIMADSNYDFGESFMLSVGAGVGFALALFLMACVREKLEVAKVPKAFRGLPIAFIVAGLFALAFQGFSGLSLF